MKIQQPTITGNKHLDPWLQRVAALLSINHYFSAYIASAANVTGDGTYFQFTSATWTEINDAEANFSNGLFTAPISGIYQLSGWVSIGGLTDSHTYLLSMLTTSNRSYPLAICNPAINRTPTNTLAFNFSFIADMEKDDTAQIYVMVDNGTKVVDISGNSLFSGFLLTSL